MSILIKGMEMPKNCGECPCGHYDCMALTDYDKNIEVDIREYFQGDKRHPDCPLIELPPHGRLIDADALTQQIMMKADATCGWADMLDLALAPTIIESEE